VRSTKYFFERWSTGAAAFDLLELITWSVNVLTHATTSPMQMTRTARLAYKLRTVANLDNMDDVLIIDLKAQLKQ